MTVETEELARLLGDENAGGHLGESMGLELLEASTARVVGRLPVEGNTQPFRLLHGGASCVLAETLGSVGAGIHAGEGRVAVGIEISATHHRSAERGHITGVATPVHLGRSLTTWEIAITDDEDRRICTSRLTCMIRDSG
ncbi:PaaI family thioesterase [Halostreptopolyspora alba]|uniref:Hotdog fold thioesterase n=1 Tax=Halostreptopolyspora alba TaxID=2487137 RepID=A0A3N0EFE0_9ACTN|nr:hotdog fold thioesterase [Nocardiopsaceae bacterium YIM 96095]